MERASFGGMGGVSAVSCAYFDTSAVLALTIDGAQRSVALAAFTDADIVASSALALTEALPAIDRITDEGVLRADLEDAVRRLWDHLHVVPVDQRCLDRAAALARTQPVRLTDAIHLAAAERLPRPLRFVTFDPAQLGVADSLGFELISA